MIDLINIIALSASVVIMAANVGLVIYNVRMARRYQALCAVLLEVACRAFLNKHLPFWIAWSRFSGRQFRMEIEPAEEDTRRP